MKEVYFSIGSNLGDRRSYMESAVDRLKQYAELVQVSHLYETAPWGYNSANAYYNCVVKMRYRGELCDLLAHTQCIEQELGRTEKTSTSYVDRVVDIDIIYITGTIHHSPRLTVPHKHMHKRGFVLVPLLDIDDVHLISHNKKASEFLSEIDSSDVKRIDGAV